jgi:lipopolysaccharide export system protein LptC
MGGPRAWAILVLLALLAGGSQWLLWLLRQPDAGPGFVGPPRSDYLLEDFDLKVLNERGITSFTVRAPRLTRHPTDGTLSLDTPDMVMTDVHGRVWQARSERAEVSPKADVVLMVGDVVLERAGAGDTPDLVLRTMDLTAWPEEDRMASESAVTIEQPGSILRGQGLRADLNADKFEILADVSAQFLPRPRS